MQLEATALHDVVLCLMRQEFVERRRRLDSEPIYDRWRSQGIYSDLRSSQAKRLYAVSSRELVGIREHGKACQSEHTYVDC